MDKRIVITALISAIGGGAIGGAVTYLTVKKTFAARAQKDIDDVKEDYRSRFDGKRVVTDYSTVQDIGELAFEEAVSRVSDEEMEQAKSFVEALGYQTATPKSDDTQKVNIYDRPNDEPEGEEVVHRLLIGYDREELKASHKPYLISSDEFDETETEWDKSHIVYYEDDDTLADEADKIVTDIEYLIGEQHLDFFGVQSKDPNVMFIRNPNISTDYEVTRNLSSYTEIILGVAKGAENLGIRRMREGDDD